MHALRARFKKDIVTEFMPPSRRSDKVVIFCDGVPTVPSKKLLMQFFARKGYWVFYPRYRGSWESDGQFLRKSPHLDILDVIDGLSRGFRDLYGGASYKIAPKRIYLFGASFGGAAAILASRDPRVTKIVALSPVIDWRAPSKAEPLETMEKFLRTAFGNAYRAQKGVWKKLKRGKFYNPAAVAKEIDGKKLFIIHAEDDRVVSWRPAAKFAKQTGAAFWLLKRGGHMSASVFAAPRFHKRIVSFLKAHKIEHFAGQRRAPSS